MKKLLLFVSVFLLLVISLAGCTSTNTPTAPVTSNTPASNPPSTSVPASLSGIESAVESIYSQNNQSVVNIDVIVPASASNPGGEALGSGFVFDTKGDIVTNNHVIAGATRITVTFYDGTTVDATLVGTDVDSDLAVIKVSTSGLDITPQPVTLGDSTQLKVGQIVVAIREIHLVFKGQ